MKLLKLLKLPKIVIRLFIAFVVISLIVGLGGAFNGDSVPKQNVSKTSLSVNKANAEEENKATKTQQEIVEDTTKETTKSDELSIEVVDTKKTEQSKESPKQNTETKNKITETQKQTTSVSTEEVKKNDEVKENKQEEVKQEEQKEETTKETPKKIEIWDELGITEYEYYNAPMWKWATVDFSIEKYGTQDACFNACTEYGESTGMGYSCSIINSYSGRYLGEMIELF